MVQIKLHFRLISDCVSTLYRFNATFRVITIMAKLYWVAYKILTIEKYFEKLKSAKVEVHQDNIKAWSSLIFYEKLNAECNKEAKKRVASLNSHLVKMPLLFSLKSPLVFAGRENRLLHSADGASKEIYR